MGRKVGCSGTTLSSKLSPADLLDLCRLMTRILRSEYDPRVDLSYRKLRETLINTVRRERSLRCYAAQALNLFPPTLSEALATDRFRWRDGEADLVKFQGDVLSAMTAAGIEPSWEPGAPKLFQLDRADQPSSEHSSTSAVEKQPGPNRAQRLAMKRRRRARELREAGLTVKEIAGDLQCSIRSVSSYLSEVQ